MTGMIWSHGMPNHENRTKQTGETRMVLVLSLNAYEPSVSSYIIPLQPHITFVEVDFIRDALACPLDPVLNEPGWRPAAVCC